MAYFLDQAKNFGQLSLRATLQSMMNAKLSHQILALPQKRANQDDSNDIPPLPTCEFQLVFPLSWIKDYSGLS